MKRYRIGRSIKRGGTAEIFEATSVGEGGFERRVVVKRLLSLEDESYLRSFEDEARIASALHHANIVGVLDFGIDDEGPYLVMEWVDGEDLAALIERAGAPVPVEVALHIGCEIAHGLGHAHRAKDGGGQPMKVVHRDVSPENVLVSWEGDVKLTDFGIALARERLEKTQVGVTKGKLSYMAPEQLRAEPVDARADIFGLGCVLHAMLVGRSPMTEGRLIDRAIPEELSAIIERATRPSRAERYASADEMALDMSKALMPKLAISPRARLCAWTKTLEKKRAPVLDDLDALLADVAPATPPMPRPRTIALGGDRAAPVEEIMPTRAMELPGKPSAPPRWRAPAGAVLIALGVGGGAIWASRAPEPVPVAPSPAPSFAVRAIVASATAASIAPEPPPPSASPAPPPPSASRAPPLRPRAATAPASEATPAPEADVDLARRSLVKIRQSLAALPETVALDVKKPLEIRFLDLAGRTKAGLTAEEYRRLIVQAELLEADVSAARR